MNDERLGKYGAIIFDGSCGMCSTFIGRKQDFFERYGFSVVPLQEEWIRELTGIEERILLEAIHLRARDGAIFRGIDALGYFAGKVWWLRPLHLLLRVSILQPFFAKLYNWIAKRRQSISSTCGWKPQMPDHT